MPSGDFTDWPPRCPSIRGRPRPTWPPSTTRPPPPRPKESKRTKQTLNEYRQLLEHHLATWPQAPSTGQVAWWLGRLYDHDGDWPEAIATFRRVPPGHAQYAAAVEGAARAYQRLLDHARAAGKPDPETASQAVDWLRQIIADAPGKPADQAALARQATLWAARFSLSDIPGGADDAEDLLKQALADAPDAPADWQAAANLLWWRRWSSGSVTTKRPRVWPRERTHWPANCWRCWND